LVLSVVFLILVLAISGILYYLNLSKQSDIDTLKKEISSLDNRAKELKNKPEVQIYSLIENNKNTIAELEKRSKITTYMKHLKSIANTTKYGVRFN
jgi:CII-binding regulator of phage lambda lysogenization HflD